MAQLMSVLTGDPVGALAVNLIDGDVRMDAYTEIHARVKEKLSGELEDLDRSITKQAFMCFLYGSKAEPERAFGEHVGVFHEAMNEIVPGAVSLRDDLINIWQPYALSHTWVMPDGFTVHSQVNSTIEHEIVTYGVATTVPQKINKGKAKGLSLAALIIHSVDGLVVREMTRRAKYCPDQFKRVCEALESPSNTPVYSATLQRLIDIGLESGFVSVRMMDYITPSNVNQIPMTMKHELIRLMIDMRQHKPYDLISIHDSFKCLAGYMNHTRKHYLNILCQLADSDLLQFIARTITGKRMTVDKISNNLSTKMHKANYHLS